MSSKLDTRDLQTRLDELEAEYDALKDIVTEAEEELKAADEPEDDAKQEFADARDALQEFEGSDDYKELIELQEMKEEIYSWDDGEALIPADNWEDYCQELCEEMGYISKDFRGGSLLTGRKQPTTSPRTTARLITRARLIITAMCN